MYGLRGLSGGALLRYKTTLDAFARRLAGVSVKAFLSDPKFHSERKNMLEFMLSWSEYTRFTTDALCLINFTKTLQIPEELQLRKGPFRDVYDEMLANALTYIFEIPEFQNSPNIVQKTFPSLQFDSDGLFIGSEKSVEYCKNGLFIDGYFIPYHQWLVSKPVSRSMSDGLIETLLRMKSSRNDVSHFGLRLDCNFLINREFHISLETRAYIRGPKGLSLKKMLDPNFPEIATGTITEHRRIEHEPTLQLQFRDLSHVEVMWSRRNGLKTVQIEELILPESKTNQDRQSVSTAYLHSIWSEAEQRFIHLDGATKTYTRADYAIRCQTPINKYTGKPEYEKVFRMDCKLKLDEWADLLLKYFYLNELIVEYLEQDLGS